MTRTRSFDCASLGLLLVSLSASAFALDVVVPATGRVTIEYVGASSAFVDTLSVFVASPQQLAIAFSGCTLADAPGLTGAALLSGGVSKPACRAELDSDPLAPGIQGFPAGTVLHLQICARPLTEPACRNIWSSNPAQNIDLQEHVHQTTTGSTTVLTWEDLPNSSWGPGEPDFNDLVVAVHVNGDADGDGIWDDWERLGGIDLNGDGIPEILLPGTNPNHKDIFVHLDYMDCNVAGSDCAPGDGHTHRPLDAAIQAVVNAFAAVPAIKPDGTLLNPDGLPGINLHIEIGTAIAHQNYLNIPNLCFPAALPGIENFDTVKARNFPTSDPRSLLYHYGLFTHQQVPDSTASGCAEMPGNDFQVSLGGWNLDSEEPDLDGDGVSDIAVGTISQQAGTLMHELGHNLGLRHGGDEDVNYKPNYLSVMNYAFQMDGILTNDLVIEPFLFGRMDYSRKVLPTLDELNLTELPGLGAGNDNTIFFCPDTGLAIQPGTGFIDWNCNGIRDCRINPVTRLNVCTPIASDVNLDGICVTAGADGVLNSVPAGDDGTLFGFYITEGRNRTCETLAVGDDQQIAPPGQVHSNILRGFGDWPSLKFDFQNTRNFEDGAHVADSESPELTVEQYLRRTAADLIVSQSVSPDPVVVGSNLVYTIRLDNRGLPPVRNIVVTDILPAAATFVSCSATGGGVCGGSANNRTIAFPLLRGGASATVTLVVNVGCAVANGTVLTNTATGATSVPERTKANNTATTTVSVVNQPPAISNMTAKPSVLWPANDKLIKVAIDYHAGGSCGPISCALSVASNPRYRHDHDLDGDDDDDDDADDDNHHCQHHDKHNDHRKSHHCEHHHHHHHDHELHWIVIDEHHVKLRAKHAHHHKDRLYTITAACRNTLGVSTSQSVVVKVPHKKPK